MDQQADGREGRMGLMEVGPVAVDSAGGLVTVLDRVVPMSVREFGVLTALMQRAGAIVSRAELYAVVWGTELRDGDRSVDVYVHKVRAKLEHYAPGWSFIHTHVGFGYRLAPAPSHLFHNDATSR